MVNLKLFPLAQVTASFLDNNLLEIKQISNAGGDRRLEEHTKTQITYNFDAAYFSINGPDHSNCMEAAKIIRQCLFPIINQNISSDYLDGVFSSENPVQVVQKNHHTTGRPLNLDLEQEFDDDHFSYQPATEQQEDDNDSKDLVVTTFRISSIIENVNNFLIGPPQHNMQPIEYIEAIELSTGVKCSLEDRIIKITGELELVKEAERKFHVIQKAYIGRIKPRVVTCLHYPRESGRYGLYFCNINLYRHRRFVHIKRQPDQFGALCVLIPTFINPFTNEYDPPTDVVYPSHPQPTHTISNISNNTQLSMTKASQNNISSTPTLLEQDYNESINAPSTPPTPKSTTSSEPFYPPTWGGERTFTSSFNTGKLEYLSQERLASAFTPPASISSEISLPLHEFPSLQRTSSFSSISSCSDSVKYRPSISLNKPKTRRVIRIVPQKSSNAAARSTHSMLHRVKAYNYHMIKNALEAGLEAVRGFKGEIRLSAKLGKVIWSNVEDNISQKIWNMEDINDIIIKELGIRPRFTNILALDENIIDRISPERLFQCRPFRKTSYYEFHCQYRNQLTVPYSRMVLHMNQGVIDVEKVVISENKVTEINWISLDRKFDFQLNLTTKELIRRDVKPFTTFIKLISINPANLVMTYEDVKDFLEVEYILHKSTTRYRTGDLFIVEITRYEKLRTKEVKGTRKITSLPGQGEIWYGLEVIYTLCDAPFKDNLNLDVGCEAKWKIEDILQTNSTENTITAFVKFLLQLIEGIEQAIGK